MGFSGGKTSRALAGAILTSVIIASVDGHAKGAAERCALLFAPHENVSDRVRTFVVEDAYEQWRRWEELANKESLRKSTEAVALEVVRVPPSEVDVWRAPGTSREIERHFVDGSFALWPKHPLNQDSTAPVRNRGMSIKAPTDHPHAGEHEPLKVKTAEDIRDAMLRSRHFAAVDRRFGADNVLIKMVDVFAIIDEKSGNEILVRDISKLSDGNYHLPGLSIPYVGREIAAINNAEFTQFWADNYASVLGRAKARMLLRYGLQMDTPHGQNFLAPLTRELAPTLPWTPLSQVQDFLVSPTGLKKLADYAAANRLP